MRGGNFNTSSWLKVFRHDRRALGVSVSGHGARRVGAILCAAALAALVAGCDGTNWSVTDTVPPPAPACSAGTAPRTTNSVFPLRVEPDRRQLLDAKGQPFLVNGDTAWSLIVQLRDADVDRYIDDRMSRGFNAVLVNLIDSYHALLAGATGQVFGNNPLWHFDGPGCCAPDHFPTTWQEALTLEGSQSMAVLAAVFARYTWDTLVPDAGSTFVTASISSGQDRVAAAVASDGSFGMIVIPSARTITLDLGRLRGSADLVWIDPTTGTQTPEATSMGGTVTVATPGTNAKGGGDWLVVATASTVVSSGSGIRNAKSTESR